MIWKLICTFATLISVSTAPATELPGLFVAVGYGGRRLTSQDGLTWENEQRWSDIAADDDDALFNVAFGAGRFIAVGGGAQLGRIVTSINGRDWRELPPLKGRVATIAFGNGRFIAAHDGELLASRDGLSFTAGARLDWPGSVHARRSACGDTEAGFRTVIIGDIDLWAETRRASWRGATSDGTRWEASALDTPPANDVAYGSGNFVVVGPGGLIESSHDGATWTRRTTAPDAGDFARIVWTGRRFVVSGGKAAWTSPDGFEWKPEPTAIPCSVAWASEDLAIGLTAAGSLFTSTDFAAWKKRPLPAGPPLNAIAFGRR